MIQSIRLFLVSKEVKTYGSNMRGMGGEVSVCLMYTSGRRYGVMGDAIK